MGLNIAAPAQQVFSPTLIMQQIVSNATVVDIKIASKVPTVKAVQTDMHSPWP
tara:strand:- start:1702 stop:1860 length:159 start_codon:yes stop_codon:yes gene_type:complete